MRARGNSPKSGVGRSRFGGWCLVLLLIVALQNPAAALAQADANLPLGLTVAPNDVGTVPVEVPGQAPAPYVAEITGNDVYIRSGPGTNFYHCGRLYRGDRVQVVNVQDGWACIIPPPPCFSWIWMQYVSINLENPTTGIVTGNGVEVYAGSDFVLPMNSTSKQVTLERGGGVRLLGEEKDDYYKIAPPEGAYLWVSSQFVQRVQDPAGGVQVMADEPNDQGPSVTMPADANTPAVSDLLADYYALSKLVNAEREKPMAQQDYAELKEKLQAIAESEEKGRASRYAAFTLAQVERFELACTVAKEIELQRQQRARVTEKIDEARAARMAQIEDLGRFAVVGKFEASSVYGATGRNRRFRILSDSGRTICYVVPSGPLATADLTQYVGKKVGLVGEIQPSVATSGAIVNFTQIVLLD